MKNIFNLRFRRKKWFAGLALLALVAITPILQAASGAGVSLDVAYGSRLVNGPGSPTNFANVTSVQHGNVVQFGILVHNTEDFATGDTARNFKIQVTIPKNPATGVTTVAKVSADNEIAKAPYKTSDPTVLNSANGQPFTVVNVRNLQLQRNEVADTNTPTFNWGTLENIPDARVQSSQTADSFVMTIEPNANGQMKASFKNALRVVFLADIKQAPVVTINKQVRKAGETAWLETNTAKPGDTLEYQVRFSNTGPVGATNAIVRDSLPPHTTLVPGSCKMKLGAAGAITPCDDNFVNGGLQFTNLGAASGGVILIQAKIDENTDPCVVKFLKNTAGIKTNETPEIFDVVQTSFVCVQAPTPTPTPTPPTPTPTPPTPAPTPTPVPPIQQEVPPLQPAQPVEFKGALPKTGADGTGMLATIALASAAYLYLRERRGLKAAIRKFTVSK